MARPLSTSESERVTEAVPKMKVIARAVARLLHSVPAEDLESVGYEAMVVAAPRYDPARGVPFDKFVCIRARWAMVDWVRKHSPGYRQNRRAILSLETTQAILEDAVRESRPASQTLEDRVRMAEKLVERTAAAVMMARAMPADPEETASEQHTPQDEVLGQAEQTEKMRASLEKLAPADRELVVAIYFEDITMNAYAARIGKHVSTVSRRHARIMQQMATLISKQSAALRRSPRGAQRSATSEDARSKNHRHPVIEGPPP